MENGKRPSKPNWPQIILGGIVGAAMTAVVAIIVGRMSADATIRAAEIHEAGEFSRFETQIALDDTRRLVTVVPSDTPTATNTLTSTVTPTPTESPLSATETVFRYFALLNAEEFGEAWQLLSDGFKDRKNWTGIGPYSNSWRETGKVEVREASTIDEDGMPYRVEVFVRLYYINTEEEINYTYTLTRSSPEDQWQIDVVK